MIQAGRLNNDVLTRPPRVVRAEVGSEFGEVLDPPGSAGWSRVTVLTRPPVPGIAADTAAPIRGDRVAWAFFTLVWHVGHLWWPSRRKRWRFGGRTAWAERKTVEFSGRIYRARFAVGNAFRQSESNYHRLNRGISISLKQLLGGGAVHVGSSKAGTSQRKLGHPK